MIGTSGTKLHVVGKLTSAMSEDQAKTRGFDAKWTAPESLGDYYLKFNWMK